jgi:putative transposase
MQHKGWHSRNYLPHFDSQSSNSSLFGLPTVFQMMRLNTSEQLTTLRHEMLDRGWGACWLKSDPIARIVEDAFLAFDGDRYRLHAWTVMPNHVHILFTVTSAASLGTVVGSRKRFTAGQANAQLGRSGN